MEKQRLETLRVGQGVFLKWVDSASISQGWSYGPIEAQTPIICSKGFVVANDPMKGIVCLSSTVMNERARESVLAIPYVAIVEMEEDSPDHPMIIEIKELK